MIESHPAGITLRPARLDDEQFLLEIYESTREEELSRSPWTPAQKTAFMEVRFEEQERYYRDIYPDLERYIILYRDLQVGVFSVVRSREEIRLVDIALLPAHRGMGIGRAILQEIFDEARLAHARVVLHVEKTSRAALLFTRLGFQEEDEFGSWSLMAWDPSAIAGPVHDGSRLTMGS